MSPLMMLRPPHEPEHAANLFNKSATGKGINIVSKTTRPFYWPTPRGSKALGPRPYDLGMKPEAFNSRQYEKGDGPSSRAQAQT
jgi:hypothetical protein